MPRVDYSVDYIEGVWKVGLNGKHFGPYSTMDAAVAAASGAAHKAEAQGYEAVVTINTSLRTGKMIIGGCLRAMSNHDYLHLGPVSIPIVLLDGLLTVACLADVAIRYSHYLREHEWAGGFLEWLFRRGAETRKLEAAE